MDEQVAELRFACGKAVAVREAAVSRLRMLTVQAEVVRSLGASVRQAFDMAGTTG